MYTEIKEPAYQRYDLQKRNLVVFLDQDECGAGISCCDQMCVNTAGSYMCGCRAGFTLSADGCLCEGLGNRD